MNLALPPPPTASARSISTGVAILGTAKPVTCLHVQRPEPEPQSLKAFDESGAMPRGPTIKVQGACEATSR